MSFPLTAEREACIRRQVKRLSACRYAQPDNADWCAELSRVLHATCRSDRHMQTVVSGWIESHANAPAPAEIADLAYQIADPERIERKRNCDVCRGLGWLYSATYAQSGPFAGKQYEAVTPCYCRSAERVTVP